MYSEGMPNDDELLKILIASIDKAGGASAWARANKLFSQRGNIDRMYQGERKISKTVAEKLGFHREWIKRKQK